MKNHWSKWSIRLVAVMLLACILAFGSVCAENSVLDAVMERCYEGAYGTNMYYLPGATPEQFASCCQELEVQGCVRYFEHTMGDNLYVTYKKDGKFIQASYTAYGEDDLVMPDCIDVIGQKAMIDRYSMVSYEAFTGEIRIIYDQMTNVDFLTEAPAYEAVTDTIITQIERNGETDEDWGMGYVITLEDGRYVLIDGGASGGALSGQGDIHRLYNFLKENNQHPSGEIVIAAWILTHGHQDHVDIFTDFGEFYGSKVKLEQLIFTANRNDDGYLASQVMEHVKAYGADVTVYSPMAGQVFYLANARFEVLQNVYSLYPYASVWKETYVPYTNDSSLVFRMTAADQTMLWTGDIENPGSYVLCRNFGDYLKSDMVQVPHHGCINHSAIKEFYDYVQAEIVFWDVTQVCVDNYRTNDKSLNHLFNTHYRIPDETHISDGGYYRMCYLPYGPGEVEYYTPHGLEAPSVVCIDCPDCMQKYQEYMNRYQ